MPIKIFLEKDYYFEIGVRKGRVLELRKEGYFVFWEAWTDPSTGECHESATGVITYDAIVTENNYGKLKILSRPSAKPVDPKRVRRSERVLVEIARQRFRKQYVLAVQQMLDDGDLKLTRDDFDAKIVQIVARGTRRYEEYRAAQAMREKKRGGTKVQKSKKEIERTAEFHHGYKSGHTMWKWYWQWKNEGDDGLFDKYRNCGKYRRYDDATEAFIVRVLNTLWDEERVTIKSLVESVQAAIDARNEELERMPVPAPKLKKAGYDYIHRLIKEYAPLDHKIRKSGWEKAYKDYHTLGVGIQTSRALERVEIDEYTVDLFVLMEATGLFDILPASIKQILELDGKARRVTLSAAIDVHTRCLLALQIVPEGTDGSLRHTLEMIYSDKSPIADAAGAKFGWPMGGAPGTIVLDRGPEYITDDAYDILAGLGITNLGAPAGKPWLKPFIERVFRTIHQDLLLRFSGRAFSNVVERGENDSEKRASLTLEAFLGWLVRWTVDAYHTKEHAALGMSPAQAWAEATKEHTPPSLANNEMREVFGTRMRRKLNRRGLRVAGIYYQTGETMKNFVDGTKSIFEVRRWHGDVGTIDVRADNGPWEAVSACDPKWIGKTEIDRLAHFEKCAGEDEDERKARRDFINAANDESYRLKRLLGLIALPKTADELAKNTERMMRFADTAERQHAAGEYRGLLDDLDDGTEFDGAGSAPEGLSVIDDLRGDQNFSEEDSME
ncbi:DDE-type integrase/transposase/recombinase [Maritalea mobilis]|uniref:hypothetical protein n=1 Tax=Maritalea mobilis TaxID=483324 RepID=UPI001C96391B|nr:hypothetical protein [Maritalea mobilis]MBY6202839.1 DDE-type integrase/transposase/recombinase [Maritalea mobilis]